MQPLPPSEATTLTAADREELAAILNTAAEHLAQTGWRTPAIRELHECLREAARARNHDAFDPLRRLAYIAPARHFATEAGHIAKLAAVETLALEQQYLPAMDVLLELTTPTTAATVLAELHALAAAIHPEAA